MVHQLLLELKTMPESFTTISGKKNPIRLDQFIKIFKSYLNLNLKQKQCKTLDDEFRNM